MHLTSLSRLLTYIYFACSRQKLCTLFLPIVQGEKQVYRNLDLPHFLFYRTIPVPANPEPGAWERITWPISDL